MSKTLVPRVSSIQEVELLASPSREDRQQELMRKISALAPVLVDKIADQNVFQLQDRDLLDSLQTSVSNLTNSYEQGQSIDSESFKEYVTSMMAVLMNLRR